VAVAAVCILGVGDASSLAGGFPGAQFATRARISFTQLRWTTSRRLAAIVESTAGADVSTTSYRAIRTE
jgi:hypothetical protein